MRVFHRILWMTLWTCWMAAGLEAAVPEDRWASAVKESTAQIFSGSSRPGDVQILLNRLLEIADEMTATDSQLPAEFRKHLQMAGKASAGNPFHPEIQVHLQQAYPLINEGKYFIFPGDVHDMESARIVARQWIDSSMEATKKKQYRQAVRDILAFILLVTTPIMK